VWVSRRHWPLPGYGVGMDPIRGLPDPNRRSFQPPFCPNPQCDCHQHPRPWKAQKDGFFTRPSDLARIQRFRCPHCHRRFSSQTFATTYWLRYRHLLRRIAQMSAEGPALRQIARTLDISYKTVLRHVARAGRHALLFHWAMVEDHPITEPLVIDGFESFEYSQYFPFHTNLAVGAHSWAIYHFTDSPLRRKGSMTRHQRQRRDALEGTLGRPDPKAIERAIAALLRPLLPAVQGPVLSLHSDDHPAYRRALARLRAEDLRYPRIEHRVTSSKLRRTRSNPLFPVNLVDLLLRHSNANHRRETIAFSKRRQASHERTAVFAVWRNCIKKRREKESGPAQTSAMRAGWTKGRWTWRRVFGRRLFVTRTRVPEDALQIYWRRLKTPVLGPRQTVHACRFAF
jgi:transposase-like protein